MQQRCMSIQQRDKALLKQRDLTMQRGHKVYTKQQRGMTMQRRMFMCNAAHGMAML